MCTVHSQRIAKEKNSIIMKLVKQNVQIAMQDPEISGKYLTPKKGIEHPRFPTAIINVLLWPSYISH